MVESFLKYLKFEKRLSPHTVTSYATDLHQFSEFLQQTYTLQDPDQAQYSMIRSWIVSLVNSGNDPRSINRKIACLRSFYKFLMRHADIEKDPTLKIRVLKTSKRLPDFVQEKEMISILDGESSFTNEYPSLRDQLVMELLYGTGIRLSEMINLRETDINHTDRTIRVLGKRNKERVIPFGVSLLSLIEAFKSAKKREFEASDHWLILTDRGEQLYPVLVNRIVKSQLEDQTNAEKKSPHVLRHTYATHLLNKGAEINAVKELLGHSSLAATQVYTHNSMEKLKKVFEQAHPKA